MSALILPDSEPTTAEILVPSRRGFIRGTALTLASLFVAPTIIKAENLMDINTPANRLIWAFSYKNDFEILGDKAYWTDSGINASQNWDDHFKAAWEHHNYDLRYEMKRFAEVQRHRSDFEKREIFNDHLNLCEFREYKGLWVPEPKKVDPLILP